MTSHPAEDTGFFATLLQALQALQALDTVNIGWFAGVVIALALLFAAGLRVPVRLAFAGRLATAALVVTAAVAVVILANVALFRHDAHLDLTREKAFTPSAEASEVVRGLGEPVDIAYFFQKQNPGARALGAMLRQLERHNANFRVQLIDVDQSPALASSQGVRTYNSAILRLGDRRVEVVTTDDREIALGLLRLLRRREVVICFAAGHGEYDISNFIPISRAPTITATTRQASPWCRWSSTASAACGARSRSSASSPARSPSLPVSRSRTIAA